MNPLFDLGSTVTLTQLAYAVAVDTHRHFERAAGACNVTQPTLSMQIQKLEGALGTTLFDRSRVPVIPTDAGVAVIAQARVVLHEAARLADVHEVVGYDPDELARARRYSALPVEVAVWSLVTSCEIWVSVMRAALDENIVLHHATRGRQGADDIARNNAHDLFHHLWDLDQILASA